MELITRAQLTFEKVGAEITLPEDPNVWPNEILQELFKQVPYISDFDPHVIMDRVDAERGYGFGHIEVMNKTEIQQGASVDGLEAAGIKQVKVPIIIKDRKLQPFDVLVTEDAKMLPLTESRLRQAIFRPGNFDITAKTPGDMSMVNQLYPPSRQNYGGGGGTMVGVGMGKEGAARPGKKGMDHTKRFLLSAGAGLGLAGTGAVGHHLWKKHKAKMGDADMDKEGSPRKGPRGWKELEKKFKSDAAWMVGGALTASAGAGAAGHHLWKKHKEKMGDADMDKESAHSYKKIRGALEKAMKEKGPERLGQSAGRFVLSTMGTEGKAALNPSKGRKQWIRAVDSLPHPSRADRHLAHSSAYHTVNKRNPTAAARLLRETGMKAPPPPIPSAKPKAAPKGAPQAAPKAQASSTKPSDKIRRIKKQLKKEQKKNKAFPTGKVLAGVGAGAGAGVLAHHLMKEPDEMKAASVLQAILPTIHADDYGHFFDELASVGLQAAFLKNAGATAGALQALASFEPADDEKVAAGLLENLKPTVIQIVRDSDGYTVKTANHRAWAVRQETWDRATAIRTFGEKVVLAADLSGSMTMASGDGAEPEPAPETEAEATPVQEFGVYQVQTEDGEELVGHVFPNLLDIDGTPLPLALFWNGENAAVQGDIVGTKVSDEVPMLEGHHPEGRGVFFDDSSGEPMATIPLTIHATLSEDPGAGGISLMAETFDGRQVGVLIQPNIAGVMPGEAGTMLVPDTMKWMPLDECEDVVLIGAEETAEKVSHAARPLVTVFIRAGGAESFSIDGLPVEKLASEERSFLSTDEALFLLAGLGVRADHASSKLAEALGAFRPVQVKIGHALCLAGDAYAEAEKLAAERVEGLPDLRVMLVKEAAVIPDPTAVDTVLSLAFINDENLGTFMGYLPEIEEAQKKMCELLIAARLGLQEIPTGALEKAVRSTEQVLEGLKVLTFQQN